MMDDIILQVAATLSGEAGICGLAGMYAAAYVMASRMEAIGQGRGSWVDMLTGEGVFRGLGGWSWYTKRGLDKRLEEFAYVQSSRGIIEWDAARLAAMLAKARLTREQLRVLAEYDAGLQLPPEPLLYCMSEQDVATNGWRDGDVVVDGPKGYALHLYASWPEKRQP